MAKLGERGKDASCKSPIHPSRFAMLLQPDFMNVTRISANAEKAIVGAIEQPWLLQNESTHGITPAVR